MPSNPYHGPAHVVDVLQCLVSDIVYLQNDKTEEFLHQSISWFLHPFCSIYDFSVSWQSRKRWKSMQKPPKHTKTEQMEQHDDHKATKPWFRERKKTRFLSTLLRETGLDSWPIFLWPLWCQAVESWGSSTFTGSVFCSGAGSCSACLWATKLLAADKNEKIGIVSSSSF